MYILHKHLNYRKELTIFRNSDRWDVKYSFYYPHLQWYIVFCGGEGGGKLFFAKRIKRLLPGYWSIIIFNFILTFSIITILGKNLLWTSDNPIDYIINLFFLNGLIPGSANNNVVLGGWFVGTLVIFYILFPLMHKLYFCLPKYRYVLFPSVISLLSFTAMYIIGELDERLYCSNNSFAYFSFVNQLPVFALGFTLFDRV